METLKGYLPGFGQADHCEVARIHRPAPLRFVWHHILPQACGGKTEQGNVVSLCDSCHYAVHVLLYDLKMNGKITPRRRNHPRRIAIAQQGYAGAVERGTVDRIPFEGKVFS